MLRPATAAALALLAAGTAHASEISLERRYLHIRAADAAGDSATANSEMSALIAREPDNRGLAVRAYRQAMASGDIPLAMKAARTLEAGGELPPDGPVLYAVDAVARRDWKAARAAVERIEQGKLFAFMAPALRAWIALGSHEGDPLALLETGRGQPLATSYAPAQRALLLLALGRTDDGVAAVRGIDGAGVRLKLLAAAALLQRGDRRADALQLLAGDDDTLAAARARVTAGGKLAIAVDGAVGGVGELLAQASLDFSRQQLAPIGLMLGRLATHAAPRNASAWIIVASMLGKTGQPEAALAALGHIAPDDPYQAAAETMRVALLLDKGDKPAALAAVEADARRKDAGALEWGRLGDVYLSADRPGDAAKAYAAAIDHGVADEDAWALWLQRGAALERAGDWPAAKAALEKALALAPNEPVVLNHLGYAELSRRENVREAARLIGQASKLKPDDPAITDSLGWARFVQGDLATAVPLLEQAAGGDPGEPTINEHLGDAYWTAGRRREARFAWRAALVTAEDKDAERIRAKLDAGLSPATAAP